MSDRLDAIRARLAAWENCLITGEWMKIERVDDILPLLVPTVDIAFLLAELDAAQAAKVEAQARAWDKGYRLGHHDGKWHDPMRMSSKLLPEKSRRNPIRSDGPVACGCGKQEESGCEDELTTDEVRDKYAEDWIAGEYFGNSDEDTRADFDRWLAKVKADAWYEGYWARADGSVLQANPYRQEGPDAG